MSMKIYCADFGYTLIVMSARMGASHLSLLSPSICIGYVQVGAFAPNKHLARSLPSFGRYHPASAIHPFHWRRLQATNEKVSFAAHPDQCERRQ